MPCVTKKKRNFGNEYRHLLEPKEYGFWSEPVLYILDDKVALIPKKLFVHLTFNML